MPTKEANFTAPKPHVNFTHFKIKGVSIDPTNIILFDIYESLTMPGITGRVVLQDWSDLKETYNISQGDYLEIGFGREGDPSLTLKYMITESYGDTPSNETLFNTITFGFMSPWMARASVKKRSRPFRKKRIDQIITELVKECGGEMFVVKPTKQTLERFVCPYWTVLETIRYLMSFAMDENGHGGYLIWTELETDKVNFIPVNRLFDEGNNEHYGHSGIELKFNPQDQRGINKILTMNMEQTFDMVKTGDLGMGRSRFVGFNFDNTEVMNVDERIDEYSRGEKTQSDGSIISSSNQTLAHRSYSLPLNEMFLGRPYRVTRPLTLFPNTDGLMTDSTNNEFEKASNELLRGRLHTKFSLLSADILQLSLSTVGENLHKRAGRLVLIAYPSLQHGKTAQNKQYSGTYLLAEIRHSIQGMEYANAITVIADGYKSIERLDLIEWNQVKPISEEIDKGDAYDVDTVD